MLKTTLSLCSSRLKAGLCNVYFNAKHIPISRIRRLIHSSCVSVDHNRMKVEILPALKDNYMYLIIDEDTQEAAIVDPVSPDQVLAAVKENNCKLTKILTTHHHWDHAGGNKCLSCSVPDVQVYGGDDRIDALTCKVGHGSVINLGNLKIECLHTPCHTRGHICYYVTKDCAEPAVFTGDTLFSGGCGRFFEGTAEQMNKALNEILAKLPDQTKVYCGHEYTINNLKYGRQVEPNNQALVEKLEWACCRRKNNLPTVPSTIGEEKLFNPFMRVCEPTVKAHTQKCDPIDVMASLRSEKDNFKC
ncbi:hydroxyacylglutathione hydrolase, mitochondrial isoform X1 [Nasonia vitripennis]|uniref:hydroxyacylglutathione hydrolase n=2 Tax=Nasonia vitripennis TaxID=7425 RepID=A0A7M7G347_NASVI|nr:hydroxyacylglutathione hydrolase, mitochondrial isoform X1 [Nasonia vitripennis]